jgi:hypothetical protein
VGNHRPYRDEEEERRRGFAAEAPRIREKSTPENAEGAEIAP